MQFIQDSLTKQKTKSNTKHKLLTQQKTTPPQQRNVFRKYLGHLLQKVLKKELPMNTPYFLGIIGNMGPAADEYFQLCVREAVNAPTDQTQMPMVVLKNPAIADRTAALLDPTQPSPVAALLQTTRTALTLGVQCIAWPCNTAHAFLPAICSHLPAPDAAKIANMITLTAAALPQTGAALLATNGTIATNIYGAACADLGKTLLLPEQSSQHSVHHTIYAHIKAGNVDAAVDVLLQAVADLKAQGASHIILGCTELPLVYNVAPQQFNALGVHYIDPMRVLAAHVVQQWRAQTTAGV